MKKKYIILSILALVLLAAVTWVIWGNTTVGLNTIIVQEKNLPSAFDGYRIAHVSDLHNSWLWEQAIKQLQKAQPDIICITGDMVDANRTDIDIALAFAAEAVKIAPCYYVTGNHETALTMAEFAELTDGLSALGVCVLDDEEVFLTKGDAIVSLVGHSWGLTDRIAELTDFGGYSILLSHQPEDFSNYVAAKYDLVLSGHAHGGQFRIPFLGGLYAPGQGIFPGYDGGLYTMGETDMVVSRGIGNSSFPIRFNNQPEVVLIILET